MKPHYLRIPDIGKVRHSLISLLLIFLLTPLLASAQASTNRISDKVMEVREIHDFNSVQLFNMNAASARQAHPNAVRDGLVFDLDLGASQRLKQEAPAYLRLELPFQNAEGTMELDLMRVNVHMPGFTIRTSDGRDVTNDFDHGVYYQGMISDDGQSLVGLSLFDNELHCFISNAEGNWELGRVKNSQTQYILYNERDLLDESAMICHMTDENPRPYTPEELTYDGNQRDAGDCIGLFVEAGFSAYEAWGNDLGQTINFVNAIYAENIIFYNGQGIENFLEDMLIWVTEDPYIEDTTSTRQMRDLWQAATGAFTGDLAQRFEVLGGCTGTNCGAGGIAAGFDGICPGDPDESKSYLGMRDVAFNNVPTYTRNMKVIIHEFGHTYGSRHTHACVWNGNSTQIDDCGNQDAFTDGDTPEGDACFDENNPILPGVNGGTIMSYCDRSPFTGVNFSLGLNNQVLAVMLNNIEDGDCLAADCCTNDSAEPTALCQDVTVELDIDGMGSVSGSDVDDGSFDACGGVTLTVNGADGVFYDCSDVGGNSVTMTVTDESGNTNSCDANVEVQDNIPPTMVCMDISVYLEYEVCTVSIAPEDVDGGSTDACGIDNLSLDIDFFDTGDVGDNTVELTATDVNGNSASCEATVTVLKRPTVLTNLGDFEGQYSDYPVLQAELTDELTGLPLPGRDITFTLSGVNCARMAAEELDDDQGEMAPPPASPTTIQLVATTDANGVAEVTFRLGHPQPPSILGYCYTIHSDYAGDDCYEPSEDEDVFTVLQEDARVTYTGKNFASTVSGSSGDAVVVLSATVCDISSTPDAAGDTDPGDISNATVTFVDRDNGDAPISPPLEVVHLPGDSTKGTVNYVWLTNIGLDDCKTFNVGIVVDNYYTRDDPSDDQEIEVCHPDNHFLTAGGWITLENSWGALPGDPGTNCNFGVHGNFMGRNDQVGGHVNVIYRRMELDGEHEIQISSIKVASVGIDEDEEAAEICGSGMITDVTTGVVLYPSGTFIIRADDNGNPGQGNDEIRFAFYAPDGELIFSSNWNVTYTDMSVLQGGNIVFHTMGNPNARDLDGDTDDDARRISAEVYPNPFSRKANINFTLSETERVAVEVISLSGEIVTAEDLGTLDAGVRHQWSFEPSDNLNSGTYLYRITSGKETISGMLLYVE